MSGNVDNVVSPRHDVNVPLFVDVAGIAGVYPLSIEAQHVAFPESLFVLPKCPERSRCQWKAQNNVSHAAPGDLVSFVIHNSGYYRLTLVTHGHEGTGIAENKYLTSNPGMAFPALPGLIESGG